MLLAEYILHWAAVVLYAISAILFIAGLVFKRETLLQTAVLAAVLGFAGHTAAILLRWIAVGHGPYIRRYESYSSYVWVALAMFLMAQYKSRFLRVAGILVMPVSFFVLGSGILASAKVEAPPASFNTVWLGVHVLFAQLAYGAALLGTAMGVIILIKRNASEITQSTQWLRRIPSEGVLDDLSYRCIGFAFITIGVMIAAGSVWAEFAWGSYWSWDPVETWSLISWIIYGIYLHLRKIHGLRGRGAAWFSIIAFVVLLNALLGVGFLEQSQHAPYLK